MDASRSKVPARPASAGERRPPARPAASAGAAGTGASALSLDLSRVAWSVDFTLNGVSLRDVYAEDVPHPFISPHPKAIAATALCRKYASPNPSARYDAKVILHWPSELLGEGQSLTVKPTDRLSVLIKASYLPVGAATAKNSAIAGARARLGLLTPRLPALLRKRSPTKSAVQIGSGGKAGAAIQQGRRFFTKDVVVQVPEHPSVGACRQTGESERGATFTHADRNSYVLVLRKLDSLRAAMRSAAQRAGQRLDDDDDGDGSGGEDEAHEPYCVDALTVAIPLDQVSQEFGRVIGGVEVSEEDAGPLSRLAFEMVRNLDTGEMIHVSEVAERVPQGVKPEAMRWLSEEEEKAGRVLIPFISSTVEMARCAPPLPLLLMLGSAEVGASVRPTVALDRYGLGFSDRRQAALAIEGEVWRRVLHQHGLLIDHAHSATLSESGAASAARGGAARGAGASRTPNSGDIAAVVCVTCSLALPGGLRAAAVSATAYTAVVAISPQLRDAVANVLMPEQASFDVLLEDEARHGDAKPCALQVTRTGVTLVQSRFAQKHGHFDRLAKKGGGQQQQVEFKPDEADKTRARFTLNLNGKTFGIVAPNAWQRDVIQLMLEKRNQKAASAAAAAAATGTAAARADAAGCAPLVYEPPAIECGGAPLDIDVPLVGDLLELAPARVDYADGCAVQWWRVHRNGARTPIVGAVGPRYRLSFDDAFNRVEAVCTPYRERPASLGEGSVYGTPVVTSALSAVAPSDEIETAVKSAHSWEYARLPVLCALLDDGVPPVDAQAKCFQPGTAAALAAVGCVSASAAGGGHEPLDEYSCLISKKELTLRPPGMLNVLSPLVTWPIRPGLGARIPCWDKEIAELLEDELDPKAGRLLLAFQSLEERDEFVAVFHYLVSHALQTYYTNLAATQARADRHSQKR